jgi:hypothetical protein
MDDNYDKYTVEAKIAKEGKAKSDNFWLKKGGWMDGWMD